MNIRQAFERTYSIFRYGRYQRPNWGHPHCCTSDQELFELAAVNSRAQKTGGLDTSTVMRLFDSCIANRPDPLLELHEYIFDRLHP